MIGILQEPGFLPELIRGKILPCNYKCALKNDVSGIVVIENTVTAGYHQLSAGIGKLLKNLIFQISVAVFPIHHHKPFD